MLARTSLRTVYPSLRTPLASVARRAYSTPAADKVDAAADEVLKKVTDLEAQVKELKVSREWDLDWLV